MSKPMKTLTLGDVLYEVVDEAVRKRATALESATTTMSTSINDEIKPSIEIINTNISNLDKKIDTVNDTLDNNINEVNTNLNNKVDEKSEELETKIDTKITNPDEGAVDHILAVATVDENNKPTSYKVIENVKSTYEYAKQGGYIGTEEEFYQKLAQENATKTELNNVHTALINQLSDIDSNFTNSINEIITRIETIEAKIDEEKEENSEPEVN